MKVNRLRDAGAFSLRIDEIGDGGIERVVSLDERWLTPLLAPQFEHGGEAVEVSLRARPVGDNLEVSGTFLTRLSFQCSRCGDDALLPVEGDFAALYVPAGAHSYDLTGEGEGPDLEDDFVVEEYRDGVVDVEPFVAESLVLSLPAYPTCSDDCRGRCGGCGADLNEETCRCGVEQTVDPRWAALSGLRLPNAEDAAEDPESPSRRQKRRK